MGKLGVEIGFKKILPFAFGSKSERPDRSHAMRLLGMIGQTLSDVSEYTSLRAGDWCFGFGAVGRPKEIGCLCFALWDQLFTRFPSSRKR